MKKNTIKKLELDKSVISKFHTNAVKGGIGTTITTMLTVTMPNGTGTSTATIVVTSGTINEDL